MESATHACRDPSPTSRLAKTAPASSRTSTEPSGISLTIPKAAVVKEEERLKRLRARKRTNKTK